MVPPETEDMRRALGLPAETNGETAKKAKTALTKTEQEAIAKLHSALAAFTDYYD